MTWIHEYPNWPHFTWDNSRLAVKLADIRHRQGRLLGHMETLGFELQSQANLTTMTSDVLKSCAIENQVLDAEQVRSSIARRLGLDIGGLVPATRDVEGVVEMMLDATQRFDAPLNAERLFGWHAALFPSGRSGLHPIAVGAWRDESAGTMQVVSGPFGREKIHFEAPAAARVDAEMNAFLTWFEKDALLLDPVLRAALAHFWFVTIHPFEDGNGRIARAIADMALARADNSRWRYYSMSTQIEKQRKNYYNALETQQRGDTNVTSWLEWFLDCLGHALDNAQELLGTVLYKGRLWQHANQSGAPINERQRLVLNRMTDNNFEGFMQSAKYAKLAKCSTDTALRDIQDLCQRGLFIQNPGAGRSTSYRLANAQELGG